MSVGVNECVSTNMCVLLSQYVCMLRFACVCMYLCFFYAGMITFLGILILTATEIFFWFSFVLLG